MNRSNNCSYKFLTISFDGSVDVSSFRLATKVHKKVLVREKDHKFFQKAVKNKILMKKKVVYRSKIF